MSINSEIDRIESALSNAYTTIAELGGTVDASPSVDNLETYIRSIPMGVQIESGKFGDLFYEKYSNGRIHLWGEFTFTPTSSTKSGNLYYSNLATKNIAWSGVSISNPMVHLSARQQLFYACNFTLYGTNYSTLEFRIARASSAIDTTISQPLTIEIWANWS